MMLLSRFALLAGATLSLNACVGDNHLTRTSSSPSTRVAMSAPSPVDATAGGESNGFTSNRVYHITRLDSPDGPSGEWRALGSTIRQAGDRIEFTELGSGRYVSFTSPHQVTATSSKSDRRTVESAPTVPGAGDVAATNLN